jgi:hypothetical protein
MPSVPIQGPPTRASLLADLSPAFAVLGRCQPPAPHPVRACYGRTPFSMCHHNWTPLSPFPPCFGKKPPSVVPPSPSPFHTRPPAQERSNSFPSLCSCLLSTVGHWITSPCQNSSWTTPSPLSSWWASSPCTLLQNWSTGDPLPPRCCSAFHKSPPATARLLPPMRPRRPQRFHPLFEAALLRWAPAPPTFPDEFPLYHRCSPHCSHHLRAVGQPSLATPSYQHRPRWRCVCASVVPGAWTSWATPAI